jgi:hypothetical protein
VDRPAKKNARGDRNIKQRCATALFIQLFMHADSLNLVTSVLMQGRTSSPNHTDNCLECLTLLRGAGESAGKELTDFSAGVLGADFLSSARKPIAMKAAVVTAADEGGDGGADSAIVLSSDDEKPGDDGNAVDVEVSAAEKAARKQGHAAICSGKHDGVKTKGSRSFNPNFDEPALGIDADVQASLDRDPMPTAIPTGGKYVPEPQWSGLSSSAASSSTSKADLDS